MPSVVRIRGVCLGMVSLHLDLSWTAYKERKVIEIWGEQEINSFLKERKGSGGGLCFSEVGRQKEGQLRSHFSLQFELLISGGGSEGGAQWDNPMGMGTSLCYGALSDPHPKSLPHPRATGGVSLGGDEEMPQDLLFHLYMVGWSWMIFEVPPSQGCSVNFGHRA